MFDRPSGGFSTCPPLLETINNIIMVKIGNGSLRPNVGDQSTQLKHPPPPIVDETELTKAIKADWKRRNGGKSPDDASQLDKDDDVWSQDSNRYQQHPMPPDLMKPLPGSFSVNKADQ